MCTQVSRHAQEPKVGPRMHSPTHTHTDCSVQSLGRFGPEPLRCRGDWAAWGSQTMFASTSGWFALALTPFISPSLCLSLSRLSLSLVSTSCAHPPRSLHFCCSCVPFLTHSALHLSLALVCFISPALLFSSLHSFNTHTHTCALPLFYSPSLESLAFFPTLLLNSKKQFLSLCQEVGCKPLSRDFLVWLECH